MDKTQTDKKVYTAATFRFTVLARKLLNDLAKEHGLSATGYLEMTLRRLARDRGLLKDADAD